jgi:hypothetical protein
MFSLLTHRTGRRVPDGARHPTDGLLSRELRGKVIGDLVAIIAFGYTLWVLVDITDE